MDALESDRGTTPATWVGGGRTQRLLVGVVVTGAVVIAAIGFAGSYAAVRALAVAKGFGAFAPFFPIGIDAGIVVLLALDLLLTWIRIPFPLLRQTAWLLTAATIAFNGAAAWPDPLGVGMHAVIPVLFVVSVEAARHAIGRIADLTADRHMEGVRVARWLLAFPSTFRLWRRMKLWELRSYDQVIRMEQDRLVYEARLRTRYGRGWRRKAPVEALMPLRLARFGVPLAETGPAGLASAGITEPLRPGGDRAALSQAGTHPASGGRTGEKEAAFVVRELHGGTGQSRSAEAPVTTGQWTREAEANVEREEGAISAAAALATEEASAPTATALAEASASEGAASTESVSAKESVAAPDAQVYAEAFEAFTAQHGDWPNARQFGLFLADAYGVTDPATNGPLNEANLRSVLAELRATHLAPEELRSVLAELRSTQLAPEDLRTILAELRTSSLVAEAGRKTEQLPAAHERLAVPGEEVAEEDGTPAESSVSVADTGRPADAVVPPPVTHSLAPATASMADSRSSQSGSAKWEMSVDTGEATARLPEQQAMDRELSPEEQRIEQVVKWLVEAEDAEKLSGAEVARRLGVAPRTGQRDLRKARERWSEQVRHESRSRLRSVTAAG